MLRNILIMLIIAVLLSVFTYSVGTAISPRPSYDDFCVMRSPKIIAENCSEPRPVIACNGIPDPVFDEQGCITAYECSTCQQDYDAVMVDYRLIIFLFMSIGGLIAVISALTIPQRNKTITWILNGFLLGGLISIFIGTVFYFGDAPRLLRPIIILAELILIIIVALRKNKRS